MPSRRLETAGVAWQEMMFYSCITYGQMKPNGTVATGDTLAVASFRGFSVSWKWTGVTFVIVLHSLNQFENIRPLLS